MFHKQYIHGSPGMPTRAFPLLNITLGNLLYRIILSFLPPVGKFQRVYFDLLGPSLGVFILIGILNYGHSFHSLRTGWPTAAVLTYAVLMPVLCCLLCRIGYSRIYFPKIVALIGYGLYGHILTIFITFFCFHENNFYFFLFMIIFGGLNTLRIVLVLLRTIRQPAARLLICSHISVIHLLYLVFLNFRYMHSSFYKN